MSKISSMSATVDTNHPSLRAEIEDLCDKTSDICILKSPSQPVVRSRLQWLLSCIPKLEVRLDPVITHPVLEHFYLFNELPIEIRIMIWGIIALKPRKINLLEVDTSDNQGIRRFFKSVKKPVAKDFDTIRYAKVKYATFPVALALSVHLEEHGPPQAFKSTINMRNRRVPSHQAYNFPPDVIQQVQHIVKMPAYLGSPLSFEDIKGDTIHESLRFRLEHWWKGLRVVTIHVEDICHARDQESIWFHLEMREWEKQGQKHLRSNKFDVPPPGGIRVLGKANFDIKFKWKYNKQEQELDPVPCKPVLQIMSSPRQQQQRHEDCRIHLNALREKHVAWQGRI
ncbi:hypothetical protein QTJ16_006767 [Diplocarpon rosae]|uniref:2EXR domain-containing protein n=1 Tax=Diplocarpon rosae TaxID=946125 RepID=A0AAD9SVY1_9HELO|nr:hypothetical protein QTJ16_006767 [Diplocarpon rosae]